MRARMGRDRGGGAVSADAGSARLGTVVPCPTARAARPERSEGHAQGRSFVVAVASPRIFPRTRRMTPSSQPIERVVLLGFMAAGKTAVGAELARRVGWEHLDLDREIERREGRSVAAIFADDGERRF